jgi:hypothetical protein
LTNIFRAKSRLAFEQIIIDAFCGNSIWQNCAKILHSALNLNVSKKEQHRLRHLLYAGTFASCANWLVKLTPGGKDWQLMYTLTGLNYWF